jgi:uncharacterized protein YfdQ (DUF2303 family)
MAQHNETTVPTVAAIDSLTDLAAEARGVDLVGITAPSTLEGVPSYIPLGIRHGKTPEPIDLSRFFEPYRTRPARKAGTAQALTLQSFVDLVNRHKTEHSAIFANTDWREPSFTAVIDYHRLSSTIETESAPTQIQPGEPDNGKHRVRYAFPLSDEWKAWVANNGERMTQAEFACFLEDRIAELSAPNDAEKIALERDFATKVATPAEVIQLSRGLQVNVGATVKNAITLQSGEGQIVWQESHTDESGQPIKVPGIFLLAVAPFFMGEKIRVPVRLRYRPKNGALEWFYNIYRPDQFVTERVRDDLDTVEQATNLPTFEGSPEI